MKLSQIAIDVKAEEEGEWKDHPYYDGVRVLVRGINCERYRKRHTALLNREKVRRRKLGDALERQERINREALAECLAGWEGVEDEAGNAIEWSLDLAREWATAPKFRRFFDGVRELAEEIGESDAEGREAALGES